MQKLEFRNLKASEIEVRIGSISEKGLSLLIYKNARIDQKLLDEVVGPMNWMRQHTRNNANCIVSIWDDEKQQWIHKEDVGKESNTEAEKGLASDSFKRACTNWGIGRELYTAPFIWVGSDKVKIEKNSKGKNVCYENFYVEDLVVNEDREIVALSIKSEKTNKRVFLWDNRSEAEKQKSKEEKAAKKAEASQKTEETPATEEKTEEVAETPVETEEKTEEVAESTQKTSEEAPTEEAKPEEKTIPAPKKELPMDMPLDDVVDVILGDGYDEKQVCSLFGKLSLSSLSENLRKALIRGYNSGELDNKLKERFKDKFVKPVRA